jgi:lipoprotein-anchoring transpeptidase ErfK/SrfK
MSLLIVLLGGVLVSQSAQTATAPAASDACDHQPLALQVALDRAGFSPGEIDGVTGLLTRRAVEAFQAARRLDVTGHVDCETWRSLTTPPLEPIVPYTIRPEDVAGPFLDAVPDDLIEQSKLPSLAYTSPVEALGERFHASPALLEALNPDSAWAAGDTIRVPNTVATDRPDERPDNPAGTGHNPASYIVVVSAETSSLTLRTADGTIVAHAPVTVGSERDPLPVGEWEVTAIDFHPKFFYNPDLFWDADPAHSKATIAAGPNNPVGTVWIGITREHYGLHGTPEPHRIGRTSSHGCIRMTNWDAQRIAALVRQGTRVRFE